MKCVFLALLCILPGWAHGQSLLEQRLIALQPCRGFNTTQKVLGVSVPIAVDRLQDLKVASTRVTLRGDRAVVEAAGTLACRTSNTASIKGSASVTVASSAEINLRGCKLGKVQIRPTAFGGSFGPFLKLAWPSSIAPKLRSEAGKALVAACKDLQR